MLQRLRTSLPLRLTFGAVALVTVGATLIALAIGWQANRAMSARTLADLDMEAAVLRGSYERAGIEGLALRVGELAGLSGPALYALSTADGQRVAGNLDTPGIRSAMASDRVFSFVDDGGRSRLAAGRVYRLPGAPGGAMLVVARDIEDQRALARHIQWTALLGAALLSSVALALGLLVRRRLLARVDAIAATSRSIMEGNLAERVPRDHSGDELDRLSVQLNAMLDRIDGLMSALREVSDNIAHDLKTPLSRLRITAEGALGKSPETAREGLTRVIEEADGLIQTFNAMLLIARLERGAGEQNLETVDAAVIASDAAELYAPVAEDAGMSLNVRVDGPIPVRANRQLLGQAIANLIDNAIKYAGDPAPRRGDPAIDVTVVPVGERVEIRVADRGPGIAPEDRERALERFVRLEQSRSRPGTGLGLSLVAAIARMHHGAVRLEDNSPGLRVVLSLPRAA